MLWLRDNRVAVCFIVMILLFSFVLKLRNIKPYGFSKSNYHGLMTHLTIDGKQTTYCKFKLGF